MSRVVSDISQAQTSEALDPQLYYCSWYELSFETPLLCKYLKVAAQSPLNMADCQRGYRLEPKGKIHCPDLL